MKRRRRDVETFGLSFLDAICCGFGAIVLLLVITKTAEPTIIQDRGTGLQSIAEQLATKLPELQMEITSLQKKLADEQNKLAQSRQKIARLAPAASAAAAATAEKKVDAKAASTIEQRLAVAKQKLTAEQQRLQAAGYKRPNNIVGGIPVDSEYIIFVIDTSGSMHGYAWPLVIKKLSETLQVYPRVKGIQVMSDMGEYMFPSYGGQWIPDTPGRRKIILQQLRSWQPFSNSSPVEGIVGAIRAYADPRKHISIYVFGDDFTGPSIQSVLNTVARINPKDSRGQPRVRIHGIGFPTQFSASGRVRGGGIRFATLMRSLCAANGGTFVGLPGLR